MDFSRLHKGAEIYGKVDGARTPVHDNEEFRRWKQGK